MKPALLNVFVVLLLTSITSATFNSLGLAKDELTCSVSKGQLTDNQIIDVLFWHNKARSDRSLAGQCSNMLEAVYNYAVEAVAANYLSTCPGMSHNSESAKNSAFLSCGADSSKCYTGTGFCLGENIFWTSMTCTEGISDTNSDLCSGSCDSKHCSFENGIYDSWVQSEGTATNCDSASHCSAVVWQNSGEIGCSYQTCPSGGTFLLCNYNKISNFNGNDDCTSGAACSNCPSTHPHCTSIGLCSAFDTSNTPTTTISATTTTTSTSSAAITTTTSGITATISGITTTTISGITTNTTISVDNNNLCLTCFISLLCLMIVY